MITENSLQKRTKEALGQCIPPPRHVVPYRDISLPTGELVYVR